MRCGRLVVLLAVVALAAPAAAQDPGEGEVDIAVEPDEVQLGPGDRAEVDALLRGELRCEQGRAAPDAATFVVDPFGGRGEGADHWRITPRTVNVSWQRSHTETVGLFPFETIYDVYAIERDLDLEVVYEQPPEENLDVAAVLHVAAADEDGPACTGGGYAWDAANDTLIVRILAPSPGASSRLPGGEASPPPGETAAGAGGLVPTSRGVSVLPFLLFAGAAAGLVVVLHRLRP